MSWRHSLDACNVHTLGEKETLARLCELGANPPEIEQSEYREFASSLRGRMAEILGVNCDYEFSEEDLFEIITHLRNGKEVREIARHCFGARA
ncbi:MAG: hypothetical protein HYU81_01520 [Candidatus Brennerbacteria bacterium]|nr:hypothetical protein [Candidatus Brennerbacteria bacterium]